MAAMGWRSYGIFQDDKDAFSGPWTPSRHPPSLRTATLCEDMLTGAASDEAG